MRNNNNFNGPGTGLDQRVGINERPIDLLSYNAGLYRAMNKKAGTNAQEEDNPQPGPGDEKNWFYVEDVSGLGNTLILRLNFDDEEDPSRITASYDFYVSKDKESWTKLDTLDSTSKTIMYEFGECEKVYLRCNSDFFYYENNDLWYSVCINCINSYNVGGNIMSLLYGSSFTGNEEVLPECSDYEYTFSYLFYESETLISAENLILPAITLILGCYKGMFYGCTNLTNAPELPAMNLAQGCYYEMFRNCTSLTEAPQLPATTLAPSCYSSMFQECYSLTSAPQLLATILTEGCYDNMFNDCTSLTEAPQLSATTLAPYCYEEMFNGCASLNSVAVYVEGEWNTEYTYGWLSGVAAEGTLYNLGQATNIPENDSAGCPEGWHIETELPQE